MGDESNAKLTIRQRLYVWSYSDRFILVAVSIVLIVALAFVYHDAIAGFGNFIVERGIAAGFDIKEWWLDRVNEVQRR